MDVSNNIIRLCSIILVLGLGLAQPATFVLNRSLSGHTGVIYSVSFSPDGKLLASSGHDNTIRLWNLVDGGNPLVLLGHQDFVSEVIFTPDGSQVISASGDQTVRIWSSSGTSIARLQGHNSPLHSLAISPDGNLLASGGEDGDIVLWNAKTRQKLATLTGDYLVWNLAFSPDGFYLAAATDQGKGKVWRVSDRSLQYTLNSGSEPLRSVTFLGSRDLIATGNTVGTIDIWDLSTLQGNSLKAGQRIISSLGYDPRSDTLVSGSHDRSVKVWDYRKRTLLIEIGRHDDVIDSVAISPDGAMAATGGWDRKVNLWSQPGYNPTTQANSGSGADPAEQSRLKSATESQLRGASLILVDDQPYLELTSQVLAGLGLKLSGDRLSVEGTKGKLTLFSDLGSVIRYTPQSTAEVERDNQQSVLYLPLARLGQLTDRIALDPTNQTLKFTFQTTIRTTGTYEITLPSPKGRFTYAELVARDQEIQAAASRYAERQLAEKLRKETAAFVEQFNTEFIKAQQALREFSRTAIQVDGKTYLAAPSSPRWLALTVNSSRAFQGAGSPILLPNTTTEAIVETGFYQPIVYVALDQLPALSKTGSYQSGTFTVEFSRTYTLSNGQPLVQKETLDLTPSTSGQRYTYQELLGLHAKNLAAIGTFQRNQQAAALKDEENGFREQLAEEASTQQDELTRWLALTIVVGDQYYAPLPDRNTFPNMGELVSLELNQSTIAGSKGNLKIFAGPGTGVLYSSAARSQLLNGRDYTPGIYLPLDKLPALGAKLTYTSGTLQFTLTRQFERSDGKSVRFSQKISATAPTNRPKFTYPEVVDRHKAAQSAVAAYRKAQAERKAREEKARQAALHREAVISRNPQAVANFNAQVKRVGQALETLRKSAFFVDEKPYFSLSSATTTLGIKLSSGKVVGPNGKISIFAGAGSAVKYSSTTASYIRDAGGYAPTIYIPFDKLPSLIPNTNWDKSSQTLAIVVTKKIEDLTFSETAYMGPVAYKRGFTYTQMLERHKSLLAAQQSYEKAVAEAEAESRRRAEAEARAREVGIQFVLGAIEASSNDRYEALSLGDYYAYATRRGVAIWGGYPFRACQFTLKSQYAFLTYRLTYYFGQPVVVAETNVGVTFVLGVLGVSDTVCEILY